MPMPPRKKPPKKKLAKKKLHRVKREVSGRHQTRATKRAPISVKIAKLREANGLEETFREMLYHDPARAEPFQPMDDFRQMPPGVPYAVDNDGQFEGMRMWERIEGAPRLPWYRRFWSWIKSTKQWIERSL